MKAAFIILTLVFVSSMSFAKTECASIYNGSNGKTAQAKTLSSIVKSPSTVVK